MWLRNTIISAVTKNFVHKRWRNRKRNVKRLAASSNDIVSFAAMCVTCIVKYTHRSLRSKNSTYLFNKVRHPHNCTAHHMVPGQSSKVSDENLELGIVVESYHWRRSSLMEAVHEQISSVLYIRGVDPYTRGFICTVRILCQQHCVERGTVGRVAMRVKVISRSDLATSSIPTAATYPLKRFPHGWNHK